MGTQAQREPRRDRASPVRGAGGGGLRLAGALLALLSGACDRDLTVPPVRAAPTLTSFAPSSAFVGEPIVLQGTNFAPKPSDNRVSFGAVSAQAESNTSGGLVVRVPDGATEGPLAVATPGGQSSTTGTFKPLGFGHLRVGQLENVLSLAHTPNGIAASDSDVFLPSALFRVLISRNGLITQLNTKPFCIAISSDQRSVYLGFDHEGVWRIDAISGEVKERKAIPGLSVRQILVSPTGALIWAFGEDLTRHPRLVSLGANDLQGEAAGRALPLVRGLGATLARDGTHAAVTGLQLGPSGLQSGLLLVDLAAPSAAPVFLVAPNGAPVGPIAAAGARAVVALDTGAWQAINLISGAWEQPLSTSQTASLAAVALIQVGASTRVLGLREFAGTVAAWDLDDRHLVFETPVAGHPTQLAVTPQGGAIFVAGDTNHVDQLEPITGGLRERISFDAQLGPAFGAAGGLVVDSLHDPPRVLVAARRSRQLFPFERDSLAVGKPMGVVQNLPLITILQSDDGRVWVVHEHEVGLFDASNVEKLVIQGVAEPPHAIVSTSDGRLLLASRSGKVWLYSYGPGEATAKLLGTRALDTGTVEVMRLAPSGEVLLARTVPLDATVWGPQLSLFDPGALAVGGAAARLVSGDPVNRGYVGPVAIGGGVLLLYTGADGQLFTPGEQGFFADGLLTIRPLGNSPVKEDGPIASSPDGHSFVWTRRRVFDGTLRQVMLSSSATSTTLKELLTMPLAGLPGGAAFHPNGERLYLALPGLERIAVYR